MPHHQFWFLNKGDLKELGVATGSQFWANPLLLITNWVGHPRLLQQDMMMAGYIKLVYELAGDKRLATFWTEEVEIELESLVDSTHIYRYR